MKLFVQLNGKAFLFGSLRMTGKLVGIPPVVTDVINLMIMPSCCEMDIHAFFGLDKPNRFFGLRVYSGRGGRRPWRV
ncbi:MAG: hypothetical protein ACPHF4_05165 [Rubripirellula sp.]